MVTAQAHEAPARLVVESDAQRLTLRISGRLDAAGTGPVWRDALAALDKAGPAELLVDASGIDYCDMSGIGLLLDLRKRQSGAGRTFGIQGLSDDISRLLDLFKEGSGPVSEPPVRREGAVTRMGRSAVGVLDDARELATFVGHLVVSLLQVLTRKTQVRWKDVFLVAEAAGVNALPICCMMGLILGLIVAFQGAIPLKRYAGEILVADMVVIAMFREMGPLFTAIILAGRSGSAFAAEIGTMKVNEEVDALVTMGLDPVPFLAVPRVAAGMVMGPLLTVFTNVFGLIGGGIVFFYLGFGPDIYWERITMRGSAQDFLLGLLRAVVFGLIVAGMGCLQGLKTGTGARAVGESTTRAVVSSIVLIIVADGVISVCYYALGF